MSAWDVAGAVVWTPLSLLLWGYIFTHDAPGEGGGLILLAALVTAFASVFCIARLFGAHA